MIEFKQSFDAVANRGMMEELKVCRYVTVESPTIRSDGLKVFAKWENCLHFQSLLNVNKEYFGEN